MTSNFYIFSAYLYMKISLFVGFKLVLWTLYFRKERTHSFLLLIIFKGYKAFFLKNIHHSMPVQ